MEPQRERTATSDTRYAGSVIPLLLACAADPVQGIGVDAWHYWLYEPNDLPEDAPVVVHLHHSGDGRALADNAAIQADLTEAGMIGAFPDGGGVIGDDDWRVGVNKDDIQRDDRAFLADVAEDLRDRDGVGSLWLSGYSKGGAMAYDMACLGEEIYDGYLPMSGAFQDSIPEDCTLRAAPIRHLQGRTDDKWPLLTEDDPDSSHEGIIDSLRALGAGQSGCVDATPVEQGDCLVWPDCEVDVRLCFFEGGHEKPDGWLVEHRAWIDSVSR